MHDTEAKAAIDPDREPEWTDLRQYPDALETFVDEVAMSGNLEALIALACEEALGNDTLPDEVHHTGARAAIQAYAAWKAVEGREVPIHVHHPEIGPEPEILPLSLLGQWVAWSSDGLRIVASAETSVEAERLAAEAGELEPILHRPMALG